MAKADGRIEQGQSIKSAFSASKWNDLCDAADIVHGRRGGVTADGVTTKRPYITASVELDSHSYSFPHAGVAIELKYRIGYVLPDAATGWPDNERNIGIEFLRGFIAPMGTVLANSAASSNPRAIAISVEPITTGQRVVQCAVAGVVQAFVRVLNNNHRYAQVRQLRYNGEPVEDGLLESSTSGLIRICTGSVSLPNPGNIYPLPVLL